MLWSVFLPLLLKKPYLIVGEMSSFSLWHDPIPEDELLLLTQTMKAFILNLSTQIYETWESNVRENKQIMLKWEDEHWIDTIKQKMNQLNKNQTGEKCLLKVSFISWWKMYVSENTNI